MNNPALVKGIFHELRAAGVEASAKDLLRLAFMILQTQNSTEPSLGDFGRIVDSRALPVLAVDLAMKDGGWRILEFELRQVIDDLDPIVVNDIRIRLTKLLGPQWRN